MTAVPLTDQQLAGIRARFEATTHPGWRDSTDMGALLAELDRLAAELEQARQRTAAVLAVCDQAERGATRWENPLPVPEWVATVRAAAQPTT